MRSTTRTHTVRDGKTITIKESEFRNHAEYVKYVRGIKRANSAMVIYDNLDDTKAGKWKVKELLRSEYVEWLLQEDPEVLRKEWEARGVPASDITIA